MNAKELFGRYAAGERDFTGFDLTGFEFNSLNLHNFRYLVGINWSKANLGSSEMISGCIVNPNLSRVRLRYAYFGDCFFVNTDLTGADLRDANLLQSDFTNVNFRGANLKGANLVGAKFYGVDFTDADLSDIKVSQDTVFHETIMPDGSIRNNFAKVTTLSQFQRCLKAGEKNFSNITIHNADLSGIDLRVGGFNLGGSHLSDIDFREANLSGANLSSTGQDWSVKLNSALIIGCDFRNANLIGSDLEGACLINCDFRGANIDGAGTYNMTCFGVNFKGAKVWLHAKFYFDTFMPDGELIAVEMPR